MFCLRTHMSLSDYDSMTLDEMEIWEEVLKGDTRD